MVKFFRVSEKNGFLSNWWISDFTINNITFNCVEQYMMWRKAMLFGDVNTAMKILEDKNPSSMKKYGRQVKNYNDKEWSAIREEVVTEACIAKFSQNKDLKDKLLAFDVDEVFVECSPYDRIWGIGVSTNNKLSDNVSTWQGLNLLGKCLSNTRKELDKIEHTLD